MLKQEDEQAIENLFERLRNAARNSGPRDVEAEAFIRQKMRDDPAAAYYMAQTIIVQEAALREQQARLAEFEQEGERSRGGFLGSIFGGEGELRRQPERRAGPWGHSSERQVQGGSGFLAGAAQTALGVTGGVLLGSAIAGMFSAPGVAAEETPPDQPEDPGVDDSGDWGGGGDFDLGGEF